MNSFKVNCPHCGQPLEVPDSMAHDTVACPTCKELIEMESLVKGREDEATKPQVIIQPEQQQSKSPENNSAKSEQSFCTKCGAKLQGNALFCPNCGGKRKNEEKQEDAFCTKCGAKLKDNAQFCTQCGNKRQKVNFAHGAQTSCVGKYTLADFWQRAAAFLIDDAILGLVSFVTKAVLAVVYDESLSEDIADWYLGNEAYLTFITFYFPVCWLYNSLMESSPKMATLGKMALGIKVVGEDGDRLTFANATGRFFSSILSGLALGIGFLMVLWDEKRQGIHDKLAKTFVVQQAR